ncbi:MAG TPA: hypothetical protein V6D15_12410 [Oculatellaceae cyanobacterium]
MARLYIHLWRCLINCQHPRQTNNLSARKVSTMGMVQSAVKLVAKSKDAIATNPIAHEWE